MPHVRLTFSVLGYARVVTAVLACFLMRSYPVWTLVVYSISALLDAVDGNVARALNQATRFGAVLDMVTDRFIYFGFVASTSFTFEQIKYMLFVGLLGHLLPQLLCRISAVDCFGSKQPLYADVQVSFLLRSQRRTN